MSVLQKALELCARVLIKPFEGCHKKQKDGTIVPYMCPAGYPTQGWGIVVSSMSVPAITQQEADEQLDKLLPVYMTAALAASPVLSAHPERLAAITSFVFNLGNGRYRSSTLRRRVNEQDWEGAREQILLWTRGGGRVLPGLVRRRKAEAALL